MVVVIVLVLVVAVLVLDVVVLLVGVIVVVTVVSVIVAVAVVVVAVNVLVVDDAIRVLRAVVALETVLAFIGIGTQCQPSYEQCPSSQKHSAPAQCALPWSHQHPSPAHKPTTASVSQTLLCTSPEQEIVKIQAKMPTYIIFGYVSRSQ